MPRIELQNIILNNTVEQKLILTDFYSKFDYAAAGIKKHILNVEPLFYIGAIAGTEFLTYVNTKMYIVYKLMFGGSAVGTTFALNNITFYDQDNAINFYYNSFIGITSALYNCLSVPINDIYFSRFANGANASHMYFNGYRITLN